ncbi:hypothetical protein B0O80DRAFT_79059 [Mortierella sp. GBAus27b]|nr:ER membrane protein complex subunit 10 [Mortierella sp. GBA43]KAI8352627.1 hypothetical protein B0O80DRAFT_79059 [Mortierella sp. GBAus27b]
MRLSTCILALTLAASAQVLAEEVTIGVWHKLSDHESFEKRGEIRFDVEEWINYHQGHEQPTATASSTASSRRYQSQQKQQPKKKPSVVYENIQLNTGSAESLADFVLNIRSPVKPYVHAETTDRETDDNGNFVETEEDYKQRLEAWAQDQEEEAQRAAEAAPGTPAFYQIMLKDEVRGWEALSSVKSCLLVASDLQEQITLRLDNDHQVFSFDYYTTAGICEDSHNNEYPLKSLDQFKNTKVDLVAPNAGPKPRYIRAQTLRLDQTGKPEAEKTFWQKYWVYIVPVVLVMLLTGGEPEKTAS